MFLVIRIVFVDFVKNFMHVALKFQWHDQKFCATAFTFMNVSRNIVHRG